MTTARQFQQAAAPPLHSIPFPVNKQDDDGNTALMRFAKNGDCEMVKGLLTLASVDVNVQNDRGRNAAMEAMYAGHTAIVEALLKAGADVDAQSKSGETLLHYAVWQTPDDIALVLKSKPDLALVDSRQNTALHVAALWLPTEKKAVELLIDAGVDAYLPDHVGRTAADCARGRQADALAQHIEACALEKRLRDIKPGTTRPLRLRTFDPGGPA